MLERRIGIIGDGPTDRKIFSKMAKCLLLADDSEAVNLITVELGRLTIRNFVDRYWQEASKTNEYFLPGKAAATLLQQVTNTLLSAFFEFEQIVGIGTLSSFDLMVITTDAEKSLATPNTYFDTWAFSLPKILMGSIEKFYQSQINVGYSQTLIPMVIPVVAFPSTETFIAAAKDLPHQHYAKKAGNLKQILYGTTNLATLRDSDLEEKALKFITPRTINTIFQRLPESRLLIQHLSFARYTH